MNSPIIVGHRGAKGLAPENTLKSFKKGLEFTNTVECDVHLTKDEQIIVFHDATLDRITHLPGWVRQHTLKQLQLMHGMEDEKIPTLEQVLNLVCGTGNHLVLELKGCYRFQNELLVEKVAKLVNQQKYNDQIIFYSFWTSMVRYVKELCPEIPAALLMDIGLDAEEVLFLVTKNNLNGASLYSDYISEEMIASAKKKNIFIDTWVVNDWSVYSQVKSLGVTRVVTDYPNLFV